MIAFVLALALAGPDPLAPAPEPVASAPAAEKMVRRGQPVTLRVRTGALTIAAAGRALTDARQGERVRVVALATRRTLDGIVEAPGEVRLLAD